MQKTFKIIKSNHQPCSLILARRTLQTCFMGDWSQQVEVRVLKPIIYLMWKLLQIRFISLEEIQLCFYAQKSMVACIVLLSCASWLLSIVCHTHAVMPKRLGFFCFCKFNWNCRGVGGVEEPQFCMRAPLW